MQTTFPGETIRLPDGRILGFAQYGAPDGVPLFFFHGIGASRLTRHPDERFATALGVRLITIDRPGIGLSSPKPGRRLIEWPDDVAALADALHIERFAVLGWSGGGAHALACAYKIPARLLSVGLASSVAPLAGAESGGHLTAQWRTVAYTAHYIPWLMRCLAWQQGIQLRRQPQRFVERIIQAFPPCDHTVLAAPGMRQMMLETTLELYRQGSRGLYDDMLVLSRPWGFRLENITVPVQLWHGEADTILSPAFARFLVRTLPSCRATFYPTEGHFLCFAHWQEMLQALTSPMRQPAERPR